MNVPVVKVIFARLLYCQRSYFKENALKVKAILTKSWSVYVPVAKFIFARRLWSSKVMAMLIMSWSMFQLSRSFLQDCYIAKSLPMGFLWSSKVKAILTRSWSMYVPVVKVIFARLLYYRNSFLKREGTECQAKVKNTFYDKPMSNACLNCIFIWLIPSTLQCI